MDSSDWDQWLAELIRERKVPGASLAVLADGEIHTATAGVTNLATGVEVTEDTLFQIGAIAKSYTATAVMRLAERGDLGLDAPVRDRLKGFKVADPVVTNTVTPRHLLAHTSGIAGECFEDTGRGDDALERYVRACANLGQDLPLGRTMSYCNTGYSILGRMIEQVTNRVWDQAMHELLLDPAGLTHTTILPEEALRFRTAWGHVSPEPGADPQPAPRWDHARSLAPRGGIAATAGDLVRFARMHLEGGQNILSPASVEEMQRVQVDVPERWATGDHWGLGWILRDWDGRRLFGHDGNMIGQSSQLVVHPTTHVAIALLTNVSDSHELALDVLRPLLRELCRIDVPAWPEPADGEIDPEKLGRYERYGIRLDIGRRNGHLEATASVIEPLLSQGRDEDHKPTTFPLKPSTAGPDVYVGQVPGTKKWLPVVFFSIDGEPYVHMGARAQRRVA